MTPTLIHIGYHKTGTKWLRAVLFRDPATGYRWIPKDSHPVNRLIRDRPLDFDAAAIRKDFEPLLQDAETAGLVPVVCWGRLAGQAFSGGYDCKEIADRLKAVFPEARILIVIREQRSIILSTYKQYVKAGGACTLTQFLDPATEQGWRVPGFDFAYFEYDRLIDYYRSLYGHEAVLVLPYEQLVADRRDFVAVIARFAGHPVPDEVLERMLSAKRSNKAQSALAISATRPLNRFGPRSDLNPAPLFESKLIFDLATRLRKKADPGSLPATRTLAARSEERLRQAVQEAVGERYVASNQATAKMVGIDLASYGWML